MSKQKTGSFDNKDYQNKYHKTMKTKLLSFNPRNPDDMELYNHLMKQKNASGYIKELIRKDMPTQTTHKGCIVANGVPVSYWCYNCDMDVSENDTFCPYCKKKFVSP